MTPIVYDGKKHAAEIRAELKKKVTAFKKESGITPTLAIIKVSKSEATEIYTNLKEKAATEVGIIADIYNMANNWKTYKDVALLVRSLNKDETTQGIMVQLPFPRKMRGKDDYVIDVIEEVKDVDGLKESSDFVKPVVLSIIDAVKDFEKKVAKNPFIAVVGSRGNVGASTVKELQKGKYNVFGLDRQSAFHKDELPKNVDLIISATGKARLLGNFQVPDNVGIIDVGAPEPELNLEAVKDRLTFYTPVPGGIGPVTIAYLLENSLKAAYNLHRK